jgi:hypothetical protein
MDVNWAHTIYFSASDIVVNTVKEYEILSVYKRWFKYDRDKL